jgi:hypothetical protein
MAKEKAQGNSKRLRGDCLTVRNRVHKVKGVRNGHCVSLWFFAVRTQTLGNLEAHAQVTQGLILLPCPEYKTTRIRSPTRSFTTGGRKTSVSVRYVPKAAAILRSDSPASLLAVEFGLESGTDSTFFESCLKRSAFTRFILGGRFEVRQSWLTLIPEGTKVVCHGQLLLSVPLDGYGEWLVSFSYQVSAFVE